MSVYGQEVLEEFDVDSLVLAWLSGSVSNLDYLLRLNELCGRHLHSSSLHPILPWVSDFRTQHSRRDLSKSKFRLKKGIQSIHSSMFASSYLYIHRRRTIGLHLRQCQGRGVGASHP